MNDFIKLLRAMFYARLEAKTGWGRNDLKVEFEQAAAEALASATDRLARQLACKHPKQYVSREGVTGTLGTVYCPDCGHERSWEAY